eukprot:9706174-Heterocapsa_arctica.AAC.1
MLKWITDEAHVPGHAVQEQRFSASSDKTTEKATLILREQASKRKLHSYMEGKGAGAGGHGL